MKKLHHILETQQFDLEFLADLFCLAEEIEELLVSERLNKLSRVEKEKMRTYLKGKKMVSFFYQPSTRTRASFEIAMRTLGGKVIFSTENASEFSSAAKGETLEDTIRVLNLYFPDVIVLRHFETGAAKRAATISGVPIINAGDGTGQHPTQALLDLYTIWKRFKKIDGLSIAMVGDLAKGRTIRSLAYLLGKYKGITVYFVSPPTLEIGKDIKDYLRRHGIKFFENDDLREIANKVNVIYQTRIQKESLGDKVFFYEEIREKCSISNVVLAKLPRDAIIMHPLPRDPKDGELPTIVDRDGRAFYFIQAQNGLFIRAALLKMILVGY
ncbi:MAG: aspartate carbamoyltransferase [bacterium]